MGSYKKALVAATGTTAGGVLSLLNPETADLIVTDLILDIKTASTGAATVDAGIASTVASADNLIDGASVAAIATLNNVDSKGTNGKKAIKWPSGQYLTITASATTAGMVGNALIKWVRA